MRRIERTNARRKLAVRAALSAVLVASVAMGATRMVDATPTGQSSLVPAEQPEDDQKPVATPKPDKKQPKPGKSAAPDPTKAPAPDQPDETEAPSEPAAPEPTYGGPVDPKPTYTKEPDPKPTYTKPPVADGLSAEFWPYTDAVAGSSMDWKVKAYDTAGRLLRVEVRFGDGKSTVWEPNEPCGDGVSVKKFFAHTYAKAGTYTGTAVVTTGGCGAPTETKRLTQSAKVVAPEQGNGPAKPTVSAEQVEAELAKLLLHGADADGFVKKFWVDWGDGSPETYVGPRSLDACSPGDGSSWDPAVTHDYAEPGSYQVTVTVMSTNCDGGQGQTATVTLTVTV